MKQRSIILIVCLLMSLLSTGVKAEDYFVHQILDCITKEKCVEEYKACASNEICSGIINAQSGCRVSNKCNQNSKILWDPQCYINCIQTDENDLYAAITTCSRKKCHASSTLLKPVFFIFLILIALIQLV